MKVLLTLSIVFGSTFITSNAPAQEALKQVLEGKEVKEKKKRRRKKVEMCNECGKPETHCDCEGHNDHKEKSE